MRNQPDGGESTETITLGSCFINSSNPREIKTKKGSFQFRNGKTSAGYLIEETEKGEVTCYSGEDNEGQKMGPGQVISKRVVVKDRIGDPSQVSYCGQKYQSVFRFREIKLDSGKTLSKEKKELFGVTKK